MSSFAADIEEAAGEAIEAVVIGPFGRSESMDDDGLAYAEDAIERQSRVRRGVQLSWDEARPMLDYRYDGGYGAPECDAVWVWTPTRVLFVWCYDGATGVSSVPRHPQDGKPEMYGGG